MDIEITEYGLQSCDTEARIFLLVDLQEFFFRFRVVLEIVEYGLQSCDTQRPEFFFIS